MANKSVLTMFDPLDVALPPSGPATPLNGTLSKGGDGRTPLTLSTFFNRRTADPPAAALPSPKRTPNARQPLVQLDESLTVCGSDDDDGDGDENKDRERVSNGGSLRILVTGTPHGRATLTADDLLAETPYATLRRGPLPHPLLERGVLGASTASVDSLSLRDIGISLTNSTTLSLLRIPEPPQLALLRDRDSASISSGSQRRPRHPSLDNSSSLDLSLTDVSFDILHDDLAMPSADSDDHNLAGIRGAGLDDFTPLPLDDFPHTSTLASRRGGRPSHAIVNDFSTMDAGEISPVKPRSSMSPVRNTETAADGTPIMSPSRKSKFTFKRWDKGTPTFNASKSAAGTPRATSPVSTPKSTSFFDKLRGTPQESKRKPSTPLALKPATPVENPSPASTVKASGEHDDEAVDELGLRAPPAKRPLPSRTSSSGSASTAGTRAGASSPSRKTAIRSSSAFNLRGSKASSSSSASGARSPVPPSSAKTSTVGSRRVPASSSTTAVTTAASSATKPVVPRFKAPAPPTSKLPATRPPASSSTTGSVTASATKPSSKLQLPSIRPRAAPRPSVAAAAPPAAAPAASAMPKRSLTLTRPSTLTKPRPSVAPADAKPSHSVRASISVTSTTKPIGLGHARSRSQIPASSSMGAMASATALPSSGITRSNSAAVSKLGGGGGLKKPEERAPLTATRRTFGLR